MAEIIEHKPWLWRPPEGGYIGRRGLKPKEAPEKVTGRAVFTNDIYLPGMLFSKVYRSPYSHARIKHMDSSKAEALPGVWAVIRYDDPEIDLSDPYKEWLGMTWMWWRDSILPDTADFEGVRVGAMVVAESEEICDQALNLIGEGIEWEELPFILDPEGAARPDAPLMHPEINSKNNIWKDSVILSIGDVEQGFKDSDNVLEFYEDKRDVDVWGGVEPGCMVADIKGEELELWYHGQFVGVDSPFMKAPVFKTGENKIKKLKVHTPCNGATFGGNSAGLTSHLIRYAVVAASKTNRPVKLMDDYAMSWEGISFETGTARYKIGFNNDGTIVAIKITTFQKSGLPIIDKFIDSFKTPNVYVREIHSYWSKAHESCWKDGAANCTFVNLIINKVAAHLGKDPITVQLLNDGIKGHDMAWLDENVKKKYGMPVRDSLKEVIEAGKTAFDWENKWHLPGTRRLSNGRMHGVGFYGLCSWATIAEGPKGPVKPSQNPAISLSTDGIATIFFRRCDCGQSALTTYCQVVADEIGLRYEDINIEHKEFFAFDAVPPGGSGGSSMNSPGLVFNSRAIKRLLLKRALQPLFSSSSLQPVPSPFEGKTIDELDVKDSIIFEKANPSNNLAVRVVTSSSDQAVKLHESVPFFIGDQLPELAEVEEHFKMGRQCCFVEVEVDIETGQVEITKLVHAYDVGQALNPDVNDQQLYGGAYQGLGVSSIEAIYYDPQTGVKLNDNLLGYPVLTILDVGEIQCPIVETHLGFSSYGLFGCSEAGKAATAAALLVPAVYNAIGKWIDETPVTPDRVLKALGKA